MVFLRKIKQGRRSILWRFNGQAQFIEGPRLVVVCPCVNRLEPLFLHQASDTQYLEIRYKDGRTEVKPGPSSQFNDPLTIDGILTKNMITLDANEVLIVYTQVEDASNKEISSKSRIVKGPLLYAPKPNEWIHEFVWHGEDGAHKTHIVPGVKKFQKLRLIPDQFYYNISDVRTLDDALIIVKLMIFFELLNVETMLNNTRDPIADFINAICADVIAFASIRKYETFLENANQLNQIDSYPQLISRSSTVGYRINKVVFRGYQASDKLQLMNDNAIEKRTKLRLEDEAERQQQSIEDLKLEKRSERSQKEREIELNQTLHKLEILKKQHTAKIQEKQVEYELERQHRQAVRENDLQFYRQLKELGTDITQVMVSQNRNPDKLIQIVNDGNDPSKPSPSNIRFVNQI